jgi:hypothetical protein
MLKVLYHRTSSRLTVFLHSFFKWLSNIQMDDDGIFIFHKTFASCNLDTDSGPWLSLSPLPGFRSRLLRTVWTCCSVNRALCEKSVRRIFRALPAGEPPIQL